MKLKKINRKGFTLIEVMVVILIIGILGSLAMPQYTKFVEKAKITEAKSFLATLKTAQNIYYTENDSYAIDLNDLAIDIPENSKFFTYSEDLTDASATVYSYTITREGGKYGAGSDLGAGTITIDETGKLTGGGAYATGFGFEA
jgi:prepilin-type N-terminal cleavage/methylation domain-containing protein